MKDKNKWFESMLAILSTISGRKTGFKKFDEEIVYGNSYVVKRTFYGSFNCHQNKLVTANVKY